MRWNARPFPSNGDRREVRRFALWPTLIDDVWVWMVPYVAKQKFIDFMPHYVGWMTISREEVTNETHE